jgi:DNA-binding CsgD family transcriptional regulator
MQENNGSGKFSSPGLIILGPCFHPVACNAEAIRILAFPAKPDGQKRLDRMLSEKLPSVMKESAPGAPASQLIEFASGKRRYVCRRYVLDTHNGNGQSPTVAVLLERVSSAEFALHIVCDQFNLTPREKEALGYLLHGLTSKEIASRMNISPNTVKAFLRLAMTKMGVSTRSGLVGKIAGMRSVSSSIPLEESRSFRSASLL